MPRTMSRKPGRPRTSRTFRYPDDLYAALAAHAKETRRAVTTEIEIAIENHLATVGKWPPGAEQAPPSLPAAVHRAAEGAARDDEAKKGKKAKK